MGNKLPRFIVIEEVLLAKSIEACDLCRKMIKNITGSDYEKRMKPFYKKVRQFAADYGEGYLMSTRRHILSGMTDREVARLQAWLLVAAYDLTEKAIQEVESDVKHGLLDRNESIIANFSELGMITKDRTIMELSAVIRYYRQLISGNEETQFYYDIYQCIEKYPIIKVRIKLLIEAMEYHLETKIKLRKKNVSSFVS